MAEEKKSLDQESLVSRKRSHCSKFNLKKIKYTLRNIQRFLIKGQESGASGSRLGAVTVALRPQLSCWVTGLQGELVPSFSAAPPAMSATCAQSQLLRKGSQGLKSTPHNLIFAINKPCLLVSNLKLPLRKAHMGTSGPWEPCYSLPYGHEVLCTLSRGHRPHVGSPWRENKGRGDTSRFF